MLSLIANNPGQNSRNKNRRLEKLLAVERLYAEQNPSPIVQNEIVDTLDEVGSIRRISERARETDRTSIPRRSRSSGWSSWPICIAGPATIEAVKSILREAMRLDPGDGPSQSNLASLLSEVGQVDDAIRVLRDAAQREPGNPDYDLRQGFILTRYGRNEEAIKVFDGMLKRYADNDDVVKMTRPMLSVIYVNQGDYAKGEAELERLLEAISR